MLTSFWYGLCIGMFLMGIYIPIKICREVSNYMRELRGSEKRIENSEAYSWRLIKHIVETQNKR